MALAVYQASLVIFLLKFHCGSALCDGSHRERHFQLTFSPAKVNRHTTKELTLLCEKDSSEDVYVEEILEMRISKWTGSKWLPFVTLNESLGMSSDAFLKFTWNAVNDDVFGTFVCDVIGYDRIKRFVSTRTLEVDIQESEIPTEYLLNLSKTIQQTLNHFEELTNIDVEDLQRRSAKLKKSVDLLSEKEMGLERSLNETDKKLAQSQHTGLSLTGKVVELERFQTRTAQWPSGFYALLQPKTGCPFDMAFFGGTHRFHKFHVQRKPLNEVASRGSHSWGFLNKTHFNINKKGYFSIEFCEITTEISTSPWPKGSFCVHKILHHPCPSGFSDGFVKIDTDRFGDARNNVADGIVNPTFHFCCQSSESPNTRIQLPTDCPFLLYRNGGKCQMVEGMTVDEEYMRIQTESSAGGTQFSIDHHPDVELEKSDVLFHLCYYSPS